MGNSKSTRTGVKNYLKYISSLQLTKLNFQTVEKLLKDKSIEFNDKFIFIEKSEFINLCHAHFMVNTDKNQYCSIQNEYFLSLFNKCNNYLDMENDGSVNIYSILFYLIPILNNSVKEKVKSFFKCVITLNEGPILGKNLNFYFEKYYQWNLRLAVKSVISFIQDEEEKESVTKLYDIVLKEENVAKISAATVSIIIPNNKDFENFRININEIYLIGEKIKYSFCLRSMMKEVRNKNTPLEEK